MAIGPGLTLPGHAVRAMAVRARLSAVYAVALTLRSAALLPWVMLLLLMLRTRPVRPSCLHAGGSGRMHGLP